jgi:uncharacterized protein (UPF0261 family)
MKSKNQKAVVGILATLDTKGTEVAFLKEGLEKAGVTVKVINGGIMGRATTTADITANILAMKGRPCPS